jgi:DNA-directed RNA polymerase specialized sigma subunit
MAFADEIKPPDMDAAWKSWKSAPSPKSATSLLDAADPVIEQAARTHVGDVNPLVKAKARRMALSAFQTYDPSKGKLRNHIFSNLQGLKRYNAQTTTPVKVPERLMLDRRTLATAQNELDDKLGREPTIDELADHTGMSGRRIARVRTFSAPMSSGFFDSIGEQAGEGGFQPAVKNDPTRAFVHMVYADLAPIDKKVMEWTLGLAGSPQLQNQQIAAKLRITPGAVSQRKAKIQAILDKEMSLTPNGI